jgi:hypothetical protein
MPSKRKFWELTISIDVLAKLSAEDVKQLAAAEIRHIFPRAEVLSIKELGPEVPVRGKQPIP